MYEIRLHGRGGQGVVVAAEIMSNASMLDDKYCAVFPAFGVERRGTAVTAYAKYDDKPIREKSKSYAPDVLIVFDPSILGKPDVYEGFTDGGTVVACATSIDEILASNIKPGKIVIVDGLKIAYELYKNNLTNMIMLGAFAKATEMISMENLKIAIEKKLDPKFIQLSLLAAQRGYDEAVVYTYPLEIKHTKKKPLFTEKITSCKIPPKPVYESCWGDRTNDYSVIKTGEWRLQTPNFDNNICIKCGICASYCPEQCITKDENGFYKPDYEYCKGCGVCANECPKNAIAMELDSK